MTDTQTPSSFLAPHRTLRIDQPIDWNHATAKQLLDEARQFDFFQSVRLIECLAAQLPRIGSARRGSQDPLRISQSNELDCAPSTISSIAPNDTGAANIQQRFFGLLGPAGPMPLCFTEQVRERSRHEADPTLESFLNVFHHRMATLFYRAWSSGRGAVQRDRPSEDRFAMMVDALIGAQSPIDSTSTSVPEPRDELVDDTQRFFAGRFGGLHRNAEGLQAVICSFAGAEVKVDSFTLSSLRLEPEDHALVTTQDTALPVDQGRPAQLGKSAILGRRISDRTSSIRLVIGPLQLSQFNNLLVGQPRQISLCRLIRRYIGPTLQCRIHLRIRNSETPSTILGRQGKLGHTCWVGRQNDVDANQDCSYLV